MLYAALCAFRSARARHGVTLLAPRRGELTPNALQAALEREAWDGAWYRRAWFDDGTPLGSVTNEECRIRFHFAILGGDFGCGQP